MEKNIKCNKHLTRNRSAVCSENSGLMSRGSELLFWLSVHGVPLLRRNCLR